VARHFNPLRRRLLRIGIRRYGTPFVVFDSLLDQSAEQVGAAVRRFAEVPVRVENA